MSEFASVLWRVALLAVVALAGLAVYLWSTAEAGDGKIVATVRDTASQRTNENANGVPDPKQGMMIEDIWKPAQTPEGGTSWALLESTEEDMREGENGFTFSKPLFTPQVEALDGKRIKVAGWMKPLDESANPPGCPFHFHAGPAQFIEVKASVPFETDTIGSMVVSGTLELTGYDESGIFYRLVDARPG